MIRTLFRSVTSLEFLNFKVVNNSKIYKEALIFILLREMTNKKKTEKFDANVFYVKVNRLSELEENISKVGKNIRSTEEDIETITEAIPNYEKEGRKVLRAKNSNYSKLIKEYEEIADSVLSYVITHDISLVVRLSRANKERPSEERYTVKISTSGVNNVKDNGQLTSQLLYCLHIMYSKCAESVKNRNALAHHLIDGVSNVHIVRDGNGIFVEEYSMPIKISNDAMHIIGIDDKGVGYDWIHAGPFSWLLGYLGKMQKKFDLLHIDVRYES